MKNFGRFEITIKPFQILIMALTSLLSIISGLLALPVSAKIVFLSTFGAIFFLTLGAFIQSLRSPGYGVISWHLSRDRGEAKEFLRQSIESTRKRGNGLEIDCMGIKLGTVSDFLHSSINIYDWSNARIRYLILKTGSEGAKQREAIEVRPRIDYSTERGLEQAKQVRELFNQKWKDAQFQIKTFCLLPSFYIIRVNDLMFVSLYLRDKGKNCPYFILRTGTDTYFSHFSTYFNLIFDSNLAQPTQ
jgi:hypothetical protein